MNHDEAISILAHRFQSPTQGATEEYVEALHVIIEDVIDSCALAARRHIAIEGISSPDGGIVYTAECLSENIIETANDYVANHYGEEEFGL